MITHRWQVRYSFIDEVTARDRLRDPGRPSAGLWGVRRGGGVSGHHATKARNRHSEITNKTKCQPGLRRPRACGEPRVDIPTNPPPPGVVTNFFLEYGIRAVVRCIQ